MTTSSPLDLVRDALEKLDGAVRLTGDQIDARCPAHDDRTPSLSVRYDRPAGKVLINCHAGCSTEDIVAALGLTWTDLFDPQPEQDRARRDEIVAAYDYCDAAGEVLFQQVRFGPQKSFRTRRPDGRGGFVWNRKNVQLVLFLLPTLAPAIAAGTTIYVTEGEKDALRLVALGLVATCNANGAGKWKPCYGDTLRGAHVIVIADHDEVGLAHALAVAADLDGKAASVQVVRGAIDHPGADVSDHLDAGYGIEDLVAVDTSGVDVHVHPAPRATHLTVAGTGSPGKMPILPEDFWATRDELQHIRDAAHSRLAAADLVLHAVLAKIAAMSSHELVFDSGRGRSSLNYFAAVIGPSGIGKTSGASAVDEYLLPTPGYLTPSTDLTVPEPFYDGLPLGSGEGVAEAFMGMTEVEVDTKKNGDPITKKVRAMVRHNVLVVVDEGETFTRLGERTGATVSTTLRSAWVGTTIGQANGRDETTRILRAHSYSLGMVVGFQPHTALPLLVDTATGTAQRFAWVSAADPNLPDEAVAHPGELKSLAKSLMLPASEFAEARTGTMKFPDTIIAELRRDHIAKIRGEVIVDERDSQAPLMRAKMAALLALLNGRHEVDEEDWKLASTMWKTSCQVRDHVTEYGAAEKARQAELVAEARVQLEERKAAAVNGVDAKLDRLAVTLAERVVESGGMKRGDARRGMPSRDRHLYEQVVERAVSNGLLRTVDGGGLVPPIRAA